MRPLPLADVYLPGPDGTIKRVRPHESMFRAVIALNRTAEYMRELFPAEYREAEYAVFRTGESERREDKSQMTLAIYRLLVAIEAVGSVEWQHYPESNVPGWPRVVSHASGPKG